MPDQWDPKYPKDMPLWSRDYVLAWPHIYKQGSRWQTAFAAIVAADKQGEFAGVRAFFEEAYDLWEWRHALWDLRFLSMFAGSEGSWPEYAQLVHTAAAATPNMQGSPGKLRGIPEGWKGDNARIWTFKSTLLFVAGLVEGTLPATRPSPAPEDVEEFVEQQIKRLLDRKPSKTAGFDERMEARVISLMRSELQPLHEKIETLGSLLAPR